MIFSRIPKISFSGFETVVPAPITDTVEVVGLRKPLSPAEVAVTAATVFRPVGFSSEMPADHAFKSGQSQAAVQHIGKVMRPIFQPNRQHGNRV